MPWHRLEPTEPTIGNIGHTFEMNAQSIHSVPNAQNIQLK